LGYAAKQGKKEMVELLLKNGADPNLPANTCMGKTITVGEEKRV
jgi:ankyrin repeat protein